MKVETLDPSATKVFYRNRNADISQTELSGRSAVFDDIFLGLLISTVEENDLRRTGSEDQSQGAARDRLLQSLYKFPKLVFSGNNFISNPFKTKSHLVKGVGFLNMTKGGGGVKKKGGGGLKKRILNS